ncbi:MAG: hypothetical protein Q9M13_07780 [Mariprofundales bacterium]|nr:hypothetical protein [Mariprofundales bacterium]
MSNRKKRRPLHRSRGQGGAQIKKMRQQAMVHYRAKRFAEALPLYEELLPKLPDDVDVNFHLGMIYYGQMRFGDAALRLGHANSLQPGNAHIRRFLFGALRDGSQLRRMLEMAEEFLVTPLNESETVLAFLAFATVCDWKRMAQLRDQCITALLSGSADAGLLPGFCLDALGMCEIDQERL